MRENNKSNDSRILHYRDFRRTQKPRLHQLRCLHTAICNQGERGYGNPGQSLSAGSAPEKPFAAPACSQTSRESSRSDKAESFSLLGITQNSAEILHDGTKSMAAENSNGKIVGLGTMPAPTPSWFTAQPASASTCRASRGGTRARR